MSSEGIQALASRFEKITLDQMDEVSFLNRKDSKFVLNNEKLDAILNEMLSDYYILEIDELREFTYSSQYLDTPDFGMYMAHHNKYLNRYKLRRRVYEESGLTFWEVKYKSNRDITKKRRIKIKRDALPDEDVYRFVSESSPFSFNALEPKLISRFKRMTFVNKAMTERVTIDRNLSWINETEEIKLEGISIVEIKNERKTTLAQLYPLLRRHGIHPGSFSKYTYGCALLYDHLKKNMLKPKLLHLNKYCHVCTPEHNS